MLDTETFSKGIAMLESCYLTFNLQDADRPTWYAIIKDVIDDAAFLPLILNYCRSESAPTCPSDLIRFGKQMLTDAVPAPAFVANALVEAVEHMNSDYDFTFSDPSQDDIQEYVVNYLVAQNVAFRRDDIHVVLVTLVKDYSGILVKAVKYNDHTEISILTSEIKNSYRNALKKTVSRSVLSADALEGNNPLLLK